LILLFGNQIISLSLGDSKSVLGIRNPRSSNFLTPFQISTEHKTANKSEEIRVLREGGIVQPVFDKYNNPVGPPRIWDSSLKFPGLQVTRSFGDLLGKHCGVSSIPGNQ
jgi:serine/threonine protein phosphatase PrpC